MFWRVSQPLSPTFLFEPLQVLDWWKSLQVTAHQEADFTLQTDFILSGNLIKMSSVDNFSDKEECSAVQRSFPAWPLSLLQLQYTFSLLKKCNSANYFSVLWRMRLVTWLEQHSSSWMPELSPFMKTGSTNKIWFDASSKCLWTLAVAVYDIFT